ncbi:hypothetical protein BJY04DRAFT_207793 [Aspergillus karnatakaensis]|uniref:uncharacterized protein n=1 Tax=Aspergillus karnatakaensis TaxID=1810916 RepID=UPI003CCD7CDB
MAKTIAIIGATGTQGGSVLNALESNPSYKLRAVTRNPSSPKALALAAKGIEVVAADLNDEASLVQAFEGVHVIYAVTDFFEPFVREGPVKAVEIEYQQGVNLARAAAQTLTLELYIWSTLPDAKALSEGKVVVPHFEAKAKVDEFIKSDSNVKGLLKKTVFLWVTFYATNLLYAPFTPFVAKPTGKYLAVTPASLQTEIASLGSISNVGTAVAGLVEGDVQALLASKAGTDLNSAKYVRLTTTLYTIPDYYAVWAKASGKAEDVKVLSVSFEDYEALYGEWGTEMGLMMKFWELVGSNSWQTVGENDVLVDGQELLGEARPLVQTADAFAQISWESI